MLTKRQGVILSESLDGRRTNRSVKASKEVRWKKYIYICVLIFVQFEI